MRCTVAVKRRALALIVIVAVMTLAGCGSSKAKSTVRTSGPTPTVSGSSPSVGPSAPASSSAATVVEFSVDGAGPYKIGGMLNDLLTTPGLDNVVTGSTACPQSTTAQGVGAWKDVQLSFHSDGELYVAVNKSTAIPTPSGAYLGSTVAQLKTIYAQIQSEQLTSGTRTAFLVTTVSGRGILFGLTPEGTVSSMASGDSIYLKTSFQAGPNFC